MVSIQPRSFSNASKKPFFGRLGLENTIASLSFSVMLAIPFAGLGRGDFNDSIGLRVKAIPAG